MPNTNTSPSIVAGLDIRLLKNDYSVIFQNSKEADPDREGKKQKATRLLIIPTDQPGYGMSLQEMVDAVNSMIKKFSGSDGSLSKKQITDELNGVVAEDKKSVLDEIRVEIRQLFVFYEKTNPLDDQGNIVMADGQEAVSKNFEYAVCIRILTADLFPEEMKKLFELKSLTFAVWSTNRKKILERMSMGNIQDLLS